MLFFIIICYVGALTPRVNGRNSWGDGTAGERNAWWWWEQLGDRTPGERNVWGWKPGGERLKGLLFEVGAETAGHVFPRGEGAGELDLKSFCSSDDEVVGVDITWLPRVEGLIGAVGMLDGDGDVGELFVDSVVIHEFEGDGHLDVLLWELHHAF